MPDLQAKGEKRRPLTHNFANIDIFPPGGTAPPPNPPNFQRKLALGKPNDVYEQEADRVARQVVNQINSPQTVQREEMPEDEEELQMKSASGTLQREEMLEDEEELQMKSMVQPQTDGEMVATPDLEASIQRARGGGQPLSENIREPMEQAFGADFSGVRVHTDGTSDQLNQSIQAKAFTTGQDVFFRQGAYQPESRGGQELLAHELTHVVQQNGGTVQRQSLTNKINRKKKQDNSPMISSHTHVPKLQQFALSQNPNNPQLNIKNNTTAVELSKGGAVGVFKFKDGTHAPLIVKPDQGSEPVAELSFASEFHKKIAGANAPTIRKAVPQEFQDIQDVLNSNKMNWQTAFQARKPIWQNTPDQLKQQYLDHLFGNGALLMSTVPGENFEDIKEQDLTQAQRLLSNASYLNQIGMIHAVDLFFGNIDRFTGNLGNWLTDGNNIIGAIDNVGTQGGEGIFGQNFKKDAMEYQKLATTKLNDTTYEVVKFLIQEIWRLDETQNSTQWHSRFNHMYPHVRAGLIIGRKKIIHKLGSRVFGKRSRTLKAVVTGADANQGNIMWKNVKKRVKQLIALG
jgi:hypothetical protein